MGEQGAELSEIWAIMAAPVLSMSLGSAAVSVGQPSEQAQARLQHLSAGILVGAIITEIFPILKERLFTGDWQSVSAASAGFFAALLLMYSLKALDLGGEDADEAPAQVAACVTPREDRAKLKVSFARLQAHTRALKTLADSEDVDREALDEEVHGIDFLVDSARRVCRGAEPFDQVSASQLRATVKQLQQGMERLKALEQLPELDQELLSLGRCLRQVHSHTERGAFRRWGGQAALAGGEDAAPSVPWGLVLAVVVDAVIDGMLIGLASSVAASSGVLMAFATAIEMGFLGYSFACALTKARRRCCASAPILALPPLAMFLAASAALAGADRLEHTAAFCGLVAFALVALLFLVVQELLVEAHEKEDSDAWHVSVWLYVGLLLSITLDVLF